MLELHDNFQVVGEITDRRDVIETAEHLRPDVIVLDISRDVPEGIETLRELTECVPDVKVVVLSTHEDELSVIEILSLNPHAYLSKDCALTELLHAIEVVSFGKRYLCGNISAILMKNYMRQLNQRDSMRALELSLRQKQVLQLVAEGKTTKDISRTLDLSEYTVENHRRHIMKKLNIKSVAGLTKYAIREGITTV